MEKKSSGTSQGLNCNPEKQMKRRWPIYHSFDNHSVSLPQGGRQGHRKSAPGAEKPVFKALLCHYHPKKHLGQLVSFPWSQFPHLLDRNSSIRFPQRDQDDACTKEDKACGHSR